MVINCMVNYLRKIDIVEFIELLNSLNSIFYWKLSGNPSIKMHIKTLDIFKKHNCRNHKVVYFSEYNAYILGIHYCIFLA